MELYGTYDIRVNPTQSLEAQLEELSEEILELTREDGYPEAILIVLGELKEETKTVYVYVGENEND